MSREQWGHGYYEGLKAGIKAKVSFYDYCIAMHDGEDSPLGDFTYDMQRDREFPKTISETVSSNYNPETKRFEPCRTYLYGVWRHLNGHTNACREAKMAFLELYREWKRATS